MGKYFNFVLSIFTLTFTLYVFYDVETITKYSFKMVFQGGSTRRISIEGGEYLWRGALKKFFEGETVSKAVKFLDLVETSRKLETN